MPRAPAQPCGPVARKPSANSKPKSKNTRPSCAKTSSGDANALAQRRRLLPETRCKAAFLDSSDVVQVCRRARRTKSEELSHDCLNGSAIEALEKVRRRGRTTGRIFRPKSAGDPLRGPRSWFERALKDAKINEFRWHDLRHTFASRLRQIGARLE